MDWNSTQYLKFEKERTQPARDLVNRLAVNHPLKIIDIGCGPGNSTQVLADRYPHAYILGVDNSENMISTAKKKYDALDFEVCDVSKDLSILENDFDIVFSNACIQWVPEHKQLLKGLMGLLKKSGVLAVQIPLNYNEPIHQIIAEVSTSSKWKEHFPNPRIFYTLTQGEYFDVLSEISDDFAIWETIYYHVMKSHSAILDWYRGTGLRPYLNALNEAEKDGFESDIMEQLVKRYPVQKNGDIIFRFPRLFFIAQR